METARSLSAVLGLKKGSLTVRPHPVTWKPHILLRRVEFDPGDVPETDEKSGKPLVYFSFFAAKKIDVKPGKEILVALADDFGGEDKTVVIGGVLRDEDEPEDAEEPPQATLVVDQTPIDSTEPPPLTRFPPKMRKGWTRRPVDEAELQGKQHMAVYLMIDIERVWVV